ncbi:Dihydroorotase [Planctomycetes bacterium Pan216]|uniref:Dihydroorotase n=1 Tax=Kolteria novifilia TaxID=2527975 RepID=A0A518AWW5_9BACT|nr:Dihydroorotase [Planctomycetes bacterium Pan216]
MIIQGRLADIDGVKKAQLRVDEGRIVEVGTGLGDPDHVFSDDCLIFSGFGDVHVHARQDPSGKECHKEEFATAAAAAIHGGVVHIADMPNNPDAPVDEAAYARKEALVPDDCPVGFTFYAGIGPGTKPLERKVPYKAYMGPSIGQLFFRTQAQLDETLADYSGKYIAFHCEDPELLASYSSEGTHEQKRPPICEVTAVRFAIEMIKKHRFHGHVAHLSVGEALPYIYVAKAMGLPITTEVTPHHLFFDQAGITPENRTFMQMNPPLRTRADRETLLEGLRDGMIDMLATDHAPHLLEEKARGISGQPHLDTYGPFVTWLLLEKGFTPERIAMICSAKPGAFYSRYHEGTLGHLLPEHDATFTVLNLARPTTVERGDIRSKCGWSPFEGVTFPGSVEAVFVQGNRITS